MKNLLVKASTPSHPLSLQDAGDASVPTCY